MQYAPGLRMRSGPDRQHSREIREEFNVLREDGAHGIRPFVPSGKHKVIYLAVIIGDQAGPNVREGSVCIDGLDVRGITLESLRSQISVVLQDTVLFSSTVADNIAYGRALATREEIVEAATRDRKSVV